MPQRAPSSSPRPSMGNGRSMGVFIYFERQSRRIVLVWGVGLVLAIGLLDYLSGASISLSLFYILPVFLVTWFVGVREGRWISLLCAADFLIVNHLLLPQTGLLTQTWNMFVRLAVFLSFASVISALRNALAHEQELARKDPLTGIANRRQFYEQAELAISGTRRHGRPFTLAYLDVDNFKTVNDRLGHEAGDSLLCLIASTLSGGTRTLDVAARLGGDEFGILFPDTDSSSAEVVVKKLRESLTAATQAGGWPVTVSIGLSTFTVPPDSVNAMIAKADALMYEVKAGGKDAFRCAIDPGRA